MLWLPVDAGMLVFPRNSETAGSADVPEVAKNLVVDFFQLYPPRPIEKRGLSSGG